MADLMAEVRKIASLGSTSTGKTEGIRMSAGVLIGVVGLIVSFITIIGAVVIVARMMPVK